MKKYTANILKKENHFFWILLICLILFFFLFYKFKDFIKSFNLFDNKNQEIFDEYTSEISNPLEAASNADLIESYMNAAGTDDQSIISLLNSLNKNQLDDMYLSFGNRVNWTMLIPSENMDLFGWYNSEFWNSTDTKETVKQIYKSKNPKYKYQ